MTGRGVTVAVVDSGVASGHPHVGLVARGVFFGGDGSEQPDFTDRIGHGTAVTAAIVEKAPAVEILAVKVFDRELATSAAVLARGITWAAEHGARLINLSLGTSNVERETILRAAVERAASLGATVVSASEVDGAHWLPGSLPGVVGVTLDWQCPRDAVVVDTDDAGALVFRASGYPRPIPGVAPSRNLSGVSFAVANVTGFLALLMEDAAHIWSTERIARTLVLSS
jgi:subtilisin family serine protease